jgi:hypothetical protein
MVLLKNAMHALQSQVGALYLPRIGTSGVARTGPPAR